MHDLRGARRHLALLPLLLGAAAPIACRQTPAQRLVREFAGAYPTEARPTGQVRTFEIVAAETELEPLEGERLRVWAYNGQVPGPTLRVRLGDTVHVHFVNHLPQPTTIHWHGVRLPNAMDGVPNLTQPPVAPGASFDYQFTPKDAGTFWFHPHVRSSEQVERGLYGVLIVEDAERPPYSQDLLWVLDDWLLDERGQVFPEFNTRHDLAHDGRWGRVITVNGHTAERLALRAGERVRLRLVDTANGRVFKPDFGALEVQIIAVDGLYLRHPIPYRGFELAPGNRLDLDITAPSTSSGAFVVTDRFYPPMPHDLGTVVIDDIAPPATAFPSPARAHVPVWREGLAVPVTKQFRLNARQGGEYGIEWTINDQAFHHDDGTHEMAGHDAHDAHAMPPPALTMRQGSFQRLQFVNESYRLHPIHLHGMFFRLLARNGVPVDEPFFRDTVLVHSRETIDIGLIPEDVGLWMMHCHILEHAEAGMMTTLQVQGTI
jgi:FtsP/CotA-like multicopper oxidase with cupredoxin domain